MRQYPFTKCFDPQRVWNPYTGEMMVVRCNHCEACRAASSARLSGLCDYEAATSYAVFLFTLTFSNEHVPLAWIDDSSGSAQEYELYDARSGEFLGSAPCNDVDALRFKCNVKGFVPYLRKDLLQNFFKRFRKRLDKYEDEKIRYFACGEYGPVHFRPHYHILCYVDSPALLENSGHTLGEFPRWTWSKRKDAPKDPRTPLSKLEYYLRKSWKFGRVDSQRVAEGSASSYVAGYLNGAQPLPSFLEMESTSPFSVHSRFLGRSLFGKELVSFLRLSPSESLFKWMCYRGEFSEVPVPREVYAAFYPKCKGFASLSSDARLRAYTLYHGTHALYPDSGLMEISRIVMEWLVYGQRVPSSFLPVCRYFAGSLRFDEVWTARSDFDSDLYDKLLFSVYSELLCSRLFCDNAMIWCNHITDHSSFYSFEDAAWIYLRKIEEFYSYLDMVHLNDSLRLQQMYFEVPFSDEGDLCYFYNNWYYDFNDFKDSLAYRQFRSDTLCRLRERMKHKELNDKNLIYSEDGKYYVDGAD